MIAKPTYLLWAWLNYDIPCFSIIEDMRVPEARRFFDYHRMFNGQSAVVFVFFSDYDLTDEELKTIAIRFMKGEYIRVYVDMYNLTTTKTMGVDKTNPRQ